MPTINVNTAVSLPAGALLMFKAGGSGRAIDGVGNIYSIGLSDMQIGPFPKAQTVQIQVTNAPITYAVELDGVPFNPVEQDPYTRQLVTADGQVVGARAQNLITFVGDSIGYAGQRTGLFVSGGGAFAIGQGISLYHSTGTTDPAGTGTFEWDRATTSVRYTAPGDTAGQWLRLTRSGRFRAFSNNGLWIEGTYLRDMMESVSSTSISVTYTGFPSVATLMRGVPEVLQFLNGNRLRINNLSTPGAAIRHVRDMLEGVTNVGKLFVQIGTNDMTPGRTPAQIEADFRDLAPRLAELGATVLSIPAFAWSNQAQRNAWNAINNTVVPAICAEFGIPFLPIWNATVDPSSTTGVKARRMQADNLHQAASAGFFAGLLVAPYVRQEGIGAVAHAPISVYDATNNPSGNLAGNPGFVRTTGGSVAGTNVTAGAGGIPDGYTASLMTGTVTSCVVQIVQADDGGNPWVEYAITGASAGATLRLEHNVGIGSTVPVAGQAMEAYCDWQYVQGSGGALRGVEARLQTVGVTTPVYYAGLVVDSSPLPDLPLRGTTPTPSVGDWRDPVGATAVRHQIWITTDAGDCTVRVRNPVMRIVG